MANQSQSEQQGQRENRKPLEGTHRDWLRQLRPRARGSVKATRRAIYHHIKIRQSPSTFINLFGHTNTPNTSSMGGGKALWGDNSRLLTVMKGLLNSNKGTSNPPFSGNPLCSKACRCPLPPLAWRVDAAATGPPGAPYSATAAAAPSEPACRVDLVEIGPPGAL